MISSVIDNDCLSRIPVFPKAGKTGMLSYPGYYSSLPGISKHFLKEPDHKYFRLSGPDGQLLSSALKAWKQQ